MNKQSRDHNTMPRNHGIPINHTARNTWPDTASVITTARMSTAGRPITMNMSNRNLAQART